MDTNTLLLRFDGRSRLLLRSLLSGATGARRGLWVFQRQRRSDPDRCLHTCLETLCQQEICLNSDAQTLTTKPLVCLFPVAFQRSLVSFLHLTHPLHPRTSVLHLLDCLSQGEHAPNPWVSALVVQLRRDLGAPGGKEPLITPQCRERLRGLCERLRDSGGGDDKATGWALCLGGPIEPQLSSSSQGGLDVVPKRKSSCVDLDSEPEDDAGQQRKRMRISLSPVDTERSCSSMEYVVGTEGLKDEMETDRVVGVIPEPAVEPQPAAGSPSDALPENVKASIPQIKEMLESEMEWDQSSVDIFKVLNDCDPSQVEILCRMLSLSEMPEQTLPQLCSCLLELSPDLSHSTAATLIKSLLLGKVLSLSEPASRCLVTAVTSLCSRYPRPTCHALIGPVLEEGQTGSAQAELLNRLIEDCLDPHFRLLVFQMTIKGIWCEGLLSVIHALLDKKLELNEELFTLFTDQLSSQAPHFTKSMKYAKMMLTVLTKYNTHSQRLSCKLSQKLDISLLALPNWILFGGAAGAFLPGGSEGGGSRVWCLLFLPLPSRQTRTNFNLSKDVTCGICMKTVYEKTSAGDRRFGIMPELQCHLEKKTKLPGRSYKGFPKVQSQVGVLHPQQVLGGRKTKGKSYP